jgi:hypothetical protein
LYVLDGGALLYGLAQLGARGIVDELDAASGAERDQRGLKRLLLFFCLIEWTGETEPLLNFYDFL